MKHRGILIAILFVLLFSVSALAEDTENTENTENTESVYMLPAELKRIESQAYQGIHTDVVVFPDTIEYIADDAFDGASFVGSGLKDIYAQDWCLEHGFEYRAITTPVEDFTWRSVSGGVAITGYKGSDPIIVIPEKIEDKNVVTIYRQAFENQTQLESVIFPDTVETIANGAFKGCTGLRSLKLGDRTQTIDEDAFRDCSGLKDIQFNQGLKSIGKNSFRGCTQLQRAELPSTLKSLGWGAFQNCSALTYFGYPVGIEQVGGVFLYGCTSLKEITVPEGVKKLMDYFISSNTSITTVNLPSTLKEIGYRSFAGSTDPDGNPLAGAWSTIDLPDSVTKIGKEAFMDATNLTEIELPENLERIEEAAFRGCTGLTSVDFPDTLTYMGWRAFRDCTGLTHFGYPVGIREVGGVFLYGCTSLKEITVPEGVYKLMDYFISGNTTITTVNLPSTLEEIGYRSFAATKNDDGTINAGAWSTIDLPDSVVKIGKEAFMDATNLTEIELPGKLERIEDKAFCGCSGLTSIDFPDTLTSLGWASFGYCRGLTHFGYPVGIREVGGTFLFGCDSLTEVTVPEGVTKLMNYFICGNSTITEVNLPSTLKEIGYMSFAATTDGTRGIWSTIHIPEGVTTIGENAFRGATNLTEIDIPASVKTIAMRAFDGCTGLSNLTLHDGLESINHGAFRGCTALEEVSLPDTVTTMGSSVFANCTSLRSFRSSVNFENIWVVGAMNSLASEFQPGRLFAGCTSLTEITLPEGTRGVAPYIFACSSIEKVHLPDSVTYISSGAFHDAKNLTEINFPDGMTNIGYGAFQGCESLRKAMLPDSVTTIGSHAFMNCTSLKEIHFPKNWRVVNMPTLNDTWGITYFGAEVGNIFGYDNMLTSVTIPDGAAGIPFHAFENCQGLREVIVPDSVTQIGTAAFRNCSVLPKVYLSPAVQKIDSNDIFSGCERLTVWCEYGSVIQNFCEKNKVKYYYLTPSGLSTPSGSVYEGEGGIYGYARAKHSGDESVVLSEVQATIWKDGSVYRQKTVNPGVTDYSLADEIHTALKVYTLPLGSYRFTLTAKTSLSSETWADQAFTVVEKIPVFTWLEYKGNPTFVPENSKYTLSGRILCNFPIEDVQIEIENSSEGVKKSYTVNLAKASTEVLLHIKDMDASVLANGENRVSFIATAAGKTETVHTFSFIVATTGLITDEIRQQTVAYCKDSDQWSLRNYSLKLNEFITTLDGLDMVCMAWSDYTGRTRQFLVDWFGNKDYSTYQVRLYEADIAEMIQEMYSQGKVPEVELPKEFKDLKDLAKLEGGVSKAMAEDILAKYKDELVLTWDNKIANLFQIELDNLDKLGEIFDVVDKVYDGVKWTNVGIDAICSIFQDHRQALEVLETILSTNEGDTSFRKAVENLAEAYQTQYGAGLARICNELTEYATDKIFSEIEKTFLNGIAGGGAPYLSIANVATKLILKLTGVSDHGDAWQTFYTRYSSQQAWAQIYQDAVSSVVSAKGNPTDEQISAVQLAFTAYKTATVRALEAVADVDKNNASGWLNDADAVRARTMPGL